MKKLRKSVAAILIITLLGGLFPVSLLPTKVQAEEFKEYERKDLRQANSKTFQTGEKTFRTEIYNDKKHFKSGGKFVEIDNNIVKNEFEEYTYKNTSGEFVFRSGDKLLDGFAFSGFGQQCKFKLLDTEAKFINVEAQVKNNRITFANIQQGVDFEITVESTGITSEFVSKNSKAFLSEYKFETSGCEFDRPFMYDGDSESLVDQSLESGILTIRPDLSKLGEIKGEIRIDPSITYGSSLNVFTSQFMASGHSRRFLAFGDFYDTTNSAYAGRSESYLKFDLGLPAGAIINSAELSLRRYANAAGPFDASVARLTQSFTSTTGRTRNDWKSKTGVYSTVNIDGGDLDFRDYRWNVRQLVQEWIDGTFPNFGLAVYSSNAGNREGAAVCSSRSDGFCQDQHDPKLIVTYTLNQPPYTPNPVSPSNLANFPGNCDESVTPSTGKCRQDTNISLTINGVGDGDSAPGDYKHTIFEFTGANTFTSQPITQSGQIQYSANFKDGVTKWKARSIDNKGVWGNYSPEFTFTSDTTPPVTPGVKPLPEYSKGVGFDQNVQLDVEGIATSDNVSIPAQIFYYIQYSKQEDFSSHYEYQVWQIGNPIFQIGPKGADGIENTEDDLNSDGTVYYFRIKARDQLNNISAYSSSVSTTIDASVPLLSEINIDNLRFSPNNPTSIGIKDSVNFEVKFIENHPDKLITEISDWNQTLVYSNEIVLPDGSNTQNISWDGTSTNSALLGDGVYKVSFKLVDKAGNIGTNSQEIFVIIDNNEANISISNPIDNLWTNLEIIKFAGQIFTPNDPGEEDEDIEKLTIKNLNTSIEEDINFDQTGIFEKETRLDLGKNTFELISIDTVGNRNIVERNVYLDTQTPSISNILPAGNTNNLKPIISFEIADGNDADQSSGIQVGANPTGFDVSLEYKVLDTSQSKPYPEITVTKDLVKDGINLEPNLISNLNCEALTGSAVNVKNGKESAANVNCNINFINDLQPDSNYKIKLKVQDIAGNESRTESAFILDSHVFSEITSPVSGGSYSRSNLEFSGRASKGSNLNISNTTLGLSQTVLLNEDLHNKSGDGNLLTSDWQVACGQFVDHDGRSDTPEEEICSWKINVKQAFANSDTDTLNKNVILITDAVGNQKNHNIDTNINVYSFDLLINTDIRYFSPNGDGNQDGINFSQSVANPENPTDTPDIIRSVLKILDSNNNTLREFEQNYLPQNTYFNGQIQTAGIWDWIQDGTYTYVLEIETAEGAIKSGPVPDNKIYAIGSLDDEVYITSPKTGFVTTNGVINIQGQAPAPRLIDGESGLKGEIKVRICIDTLASPNSISCDSQVEISVNDQGYFSSLIVLPRIPGESQTMHNVTALAFDNFGNQTKNSNIVEIILDTVDPFKSVSITPALVGINSPEEYEKFLNGEISINELRSVIIRSEVTQNTQAVELKFAEAQNIDPKFIALINDEKETNSNLNPFDLDSVKKNHNVSLDSNSYPEANCLDPSGCVWESIFPIKSNMGGIYEVEFRGKKGEMINKLSAGFNVDGSIPAAPIIIVVEAFNVQTSNWEKVEFTEGNYFTNKSRIRLRGAAEPNKEYSLRSFGNQVGVVSSNQLGLWEYEYDFLSQLQNPSPSIFKCLQVSQNICVNGQFDFDLYLDDPIFPIKSVNNINLIYDAVLPQLTKISMQTPINTLDGWIKSGDSVIFDISSNKKLKFAEIEKEDGYRKVLTNISQNTQWKSSITIERLKEGYYNTKILIRDLAGNRNEYLSQSWQGYGLGDFRLKIDNTKPEFSEIDSSSWAKTILEGGLNSQIGIIQMGRLSPGYVTSSSKLNLKGLGEKLQRIDLIVGSQIISQINISEIECQRQLEDKFAEDGLIVKSGENCKWETFYEFPGSGENDQFGVPLTGKIFQVRVLDRAGNSSFISLEKIIYLDKSKPNLPEVLQISSSSY